MSEEVVEIGTTVPKDTRDLPKPKDPLLVKIEHAKSNMDLLRISNELVDKVQKERPSEFDEQIQIHKLTNTLRQKASNAAEATGNAYPGSRYHSLALHAEHNADMASLFLDDLRLTDLKQKQDAKDSGRNTQPPHANMGASVKRFVNKGEESDNWIEYSFAINNPEITSEVVRKLAEQNSSNLVEEYSSYYDPKWKYSNKSWDALHAVHRRYTKELETLKSFFPQAVGKPHMFSDIAQIWFEHNKVRLVLENIGRWDTHYVRSFWFKKIEQVDGLMEEIRVGLFKGRGQAIKKHASLGKLGELEAMEKRNAEISERFEQRLRTLKYPDKVGYIEMSKNLPPFEFVDFDGSLHQLDLNKWHGIRMSDKEYLGALFAHLRHTTDLTKKGLDLGTFLKKSKEKKVRQAVDSITNTKTAKKAKIENSGLENHRQSLTNKTSPAGLVASFKHGPFGLHSKHHVSAFLINMEDNKSRQDFIKFLKDTPDGRKLYMEMQTELDKAKGLKPY